MGLLQSCPLLTILLLFYHVLVISLEGAMKLNGLKGGEGL